MKRYAIAGLLWVLALVIGCSGSNNPLGTTSQHASTGQHQYRFTGQNESNTVIIQGWLNVNVQSDSRLSGTWHLESVDGQATDLPLGDGTLVGKVDKDARANINLHPTFADNNMRLIGVIQNEQFHGLWSRSTLIGPVNQGTFEANK